METKGIRRSARTNISDNKCPSSERSRSDCKENKVVEKRILVDKGRRENGTEDSTHGKNVGLIASGSKSIKKSSNYVDETKMAKQSVRTINSDSKCPPSERSRSDCQDNKVIQKRVGKGRRENGIEDSKHGKNVGLITNGTESVKKSSKYVDEANMAKGTKLSEMSRKRKLEKVEGGTYIESSSTKTKEKLHNVKNVKGDQRNHQQNMKMESKSSKFDQNEGVKERRKKSETVSGKQYSSKNKTTKNNHVDPNSEQRVGKLTNKKCNKVERAEKVGPNSEQSIGKLTNKTFNKVERTEKVDLNSEQSIGKLTNKKINKVKKTEKPLVVDEKKKKENKSLHNGNSKFKGHIEHCVRNSNAFDEVDSVQGQKGKILGVNIACDIINDDVEFMSCDSDSDDSESQFEVETKKFRLSPELEKGKERNKIHKDSVKKSEKDATHKENNNAGSDTKKAYKRVSSSGQREGHETKVKKLKLSGDSENVKNLKDSGKTSKMNVKSEKGKSVNKSGSKSKKQSDKPKEKKKTEEKHSSRKRSKHSSAKDSPVKTTHHDALSHIDQSDVTAILLHMEGGTSDISRISPGASKSFDVSIEDEDSDWEEVEDDPSKKSPVKSQLPKEPIEITLDAPEIVKHRKKRQFDWMAYLQRQMNRFKRELREDIHKVHLMCLMARGMYLNRICNRIELQAVALSLIQEEFTSKSKQLYHSFVLHRLLKWMKSTFTIDASVPTDGKNLVSTLTDRMQKKKTASMSELVLLFVIVLRSLGLDVRLVMSLQPLSMKDTSKQKSEGEASGILPNPCMKKSKKSFKSKTSKQSEKKSEKRIVKTGQSSSNKKSATSDSRTEKEQKETKKESRETSKSTKYKTKNKTLRVRGSKVKPSSYDEENEATGSEDDDSSCDKNEEHSKKPVKKNKTKSEYFKESRTKSEYFTEEDDSDFEVEDVKYRTPLLKKKSPTQTNRKILSDSEDSNESATNYEMNKGYDQWVEVYVESEKKWICFDCVKAQINKPYEIESRATQPLLYVLAYDNEGVIKDVTARYASKWMTDTRKLRVNPDWWRETLDPYVTYDRMSDLKEDEEINANLIKRPLPTSIAAFKSHPLYVLTRHLLKFEAVYPETAVPLGYIKGEPIYARDCVHVLHSRENWLKEGRAVRIGEEAYKMVKSRPKWKQPKENPDALDLECFGIWQTEKYMPPPVIDGKIPRNAYGNLELFKPWMLPAGTVHLQVPGLNKVAKKLDLDCVPAMVGWDTHCGFSHPLLEGFIVCEEDKDVLLAAWDEDQEIQKQRETEKREKRVYGNWKLLIKGLLIRERLKNRYDLESKVVDEDTKKEDGEKAQDYKMSWPRKQQDQDEKKKNKKSKPAATHYKVESM